MLVAIMGTKVKRSARGWTWWYMPIISATPKVDIGSIHVQGQSRQKVIKTPSQSVSPAGWHMPTVPATHR
jgi:hypothetical protein